MAFSWFNLVPGVGHEMSHVATIGVVSATLIFVGFLARGALGTGEKAIVPAGGLGLKGIMESITELVTSLVEMIIGKDGLPFVPMFAALFFFILANNWVGLIPGVSPAVENINTTFAIGIFSFIVYNLYGFKEHGVAYLKQFVGPVWWLFMLMIPIELISHLLRPLTLGLRLTNVMTGDHIVLGAFLDLMPIIAPLPFYCLGIFVGFIQAFVFTLLSMVYVALAISHDH